VPAVRRIVRALDPTVPLFGVAPMRDVVRASTARRSLALALMSAAAAITLVLGAVGLYGVMAYAVALRTREIGVRIALGADPRALARGVAARGLVLIAVGVGVGLLLFATAAPLLRAFLYGVTAGDPVTLASAVLALVATGALASWLPARRAARVDPAEALRGLGHAALPGSRRGGEIAHRRSFRCSAGRKSTAVLRQGRVGTPRCWIRMAYPRSISTQEPGA